MRIHSSLQVGLDASSGFPLNKAQSVVSAKVQAIPSFRFLPIYRIRMGDEDDHFQ
jgi:hypothetical protein